MPQKSNRLPIDTAIELRRKRKIEDKQQKIFTNHYGRFPKPVSCKTPWGFLPKIGSKIFKYPGPVNFHEFLIVNLVRGFGEDWFKTKRRESDHQHTLIHWFQTYKSNRRLYLQILSLAFDLYIIEDNSDLQVQLVKNLKCGDHFEGARLELLAAAICIRSGLTITEYYDRSKGVKCAEFVVFDAQQNTYFDLEAKRSHTRKNNYGALINDALTKLGRNPLVIFVDLNTPEKNAKKILSQKGLKKILKQVKPSEDN